jgi:mannose-6-phosphate isomerase-like protein (cupin superfamily)
MKRSSFMKFCMAAGAALTVPFIGLGKQKPANRDNKPFKVGAGKDRFDKPINLFEGDMFYTKLSTKDTDGDLYIFESTRVEKGGPTLHLHYSQDEWWYIMEGEFLFKIGDESFTGKAGDSFFGPRMIPHAFSKINDGNARMLITFQPAGKMEAFFKSVSVGPDNTLSEEEKLAIRKDHGVKIVGPALTHQKT